MSEGGLAIEVAAVTDIGAWRGRNEDAAVVAQEILSGPRAESAASLEPPFLVAVLDGLGGHPGGDIASRLVAEHLATAPVPADANQIRTLVGDLQTAVYARMTKDPTLRGMATTLVALVVTAPGEALVVNVGDSPAYRLDHGRIIQLTVEDREPFGSITQCLGGFEAPPSRFAPHVVPVDGPARLLLCSDGLSDFVPHEKVAARLATTGHPLAQVAAQLVELALEAGGQDNVTVVLVDLPGRP